MTSFLRLGNFTVNTRYIRTIEKKDNAYYLEMQSKAASKSSDFFVGYSFCTPYYKFDKKTTEYQAIDTFIKNLPNA